MHLDKELSPAESDFDSDDLQDLRFQAEIEQYNAIVAKAHVAAENDCQRQQQEQEQEQEQNQSNDIEMGKTGTGLTDKDG